MLISRFTKNLILFAKTVKIRNWIQNISKTVCGLLVSKYTKNPLKISKLVQKNSCDLLVVPKYAKNQLKPCKMVQKISYSPAQSDTTVCDLLVSKYAKNQLKTKILTKMTKNSLTKINDTTPKGLWRSNRRLGPERWQNGTGCAGDEPLHTFRVPWGGLCCKRIRFL